MLSWYFELVGDVILFMLYWSLMTQKKCIQEMTEVQKEAKYNTKRITSPTSSKYQDNIVEKWLERKHHILRKRILPRVIEIEGFNRKEPTTTGTSTVLEIVLIGIKKTLLRLKMKDMNMNQVYNAHSTILFY